MLTKLRPSWPGRILGTVALSSALALGVGAATASAQPASGGITLPASS